MRNFDEEFAVNVISNTFNDYSANNVNYQCNFNPLDKIVELYESKIALYERMIKDKDGMINKLDQLINNK